MNKTNLIKAFPSYFILILLPLAFGLSLYIIVLNTDKNLKFEQTKSEISERATDFIAKTTALDYFQPYFKKLANKLFPFVENRKNEDGINLTNEDVTNIINKFKDSLGENIRCALFDKEARLLNPQDLLDYEQRFFTYVWKDIHNIEDNYYKEKRADQVSIIGKDFNISHLYNHSEHCIPTSSLGKTGLFYFKNANNEKNGIIIFVEYKKTSLELIEAKIKDYATQKQPIILYSLESRQRKTPTFGHQEISFSETETDEFLNGFYKDDMVWKGFISDNYKLLLGQQVYYQNQYLTNVLKAIILFIILLSIASFFYYRNIANNNGLYISIRYKLVFLFALAIYMPTLSIWVLSYVSLKNHRIAIENDVLKGMQDSINKIDSDYKKYEDLLYNGFQKLDSYLKSFSGKKPPTAREVHNKLRDIASKNPQNISYQFNWLDIRNIDQTQIYTTSNTESNERLSKIGKVVSILCLDKYCPERLNDIGIKPSQSDIIIGDILVNPVVGFGSVFDRPNKLVYVNFEGSQIYWWWNYYPDKNNPISFCFCNASAQHCTLEYFKEIALKKYSYGSTNLKVLFFHNINHTFIPTDSGNNELLDLINVSNINKTIESANISYNKQKYLCLCIPGSLLKDCFVLSLYPISEIDYRIEKLRSSIYIVMVLLLIISVLTGLLLAKNFIMPVNELNRGLVALRKRETETTIDIENKDELGLLGQAFNQMMVEIKDLILASSVQQCLIPSGNYKLDSYDCFVYNQMAANLGGDYADIIELPNNKVLIVIGKVTGQGISASLLTAMVKASVFRFANKPGVTLNEIVSKTSQMINELLNEKKHMTLCAVILDEKSGEISVCNAGHLFPIIKEKESGKYRTTKLSGHPLGASNIGCKYTSEPEKLNFDETLILFTDGLPEAENAQGEVLGINKFIKLIIDLPSTSAEEMKNNLLDIFKKHHGDAELNDDLTFVILRRKPLQDS